MKKCNEIPLERFITFTNSNDVCAVVNLRVDLVSELRKHKFEIAVEDVHYVCRVLVADDIRPKDDISADSEPEVSVLQTIRTYMNTIRTTVIYYIHVFCDDEKVIICSNFFFFFIRIQIFHKRSCASADNTYLTKYEPYATKMNDEDVLNMFEMDYERAIDAIRNYLAMRETDGGHVRAQTAFAKLSTIFEEIKAALSDARSTSTAFMHFCMDYRGRLLDEVKAYLADTKGDSVHTEEANLRSVHGKLVEIICDNDTSKCTHDILHLMGKSFRKEPNAHFPACRLAHKRRMIEVISNSDNAKPIIADMKWFCLTGVAMFQPWHLLERKLRHKSMTKSSRLCPMWHFE